MLKFSYYWILPLLFLHGTVFAAPLLEVRTTSPSTPTNSYINSCILNDRGQVVIEHNVWLFPSGPNLASKEIRAANLSVKNIKSVIAQAEMGNVTGVDPIGGSTYKYFAYQKQANGSLKEIFLLNKNGQGSFNDSPVVEPLSRFIDSICGVLSPI